MDSEQEELKLGEDDKLVQSFERNVVELNKRGFIFTDKGRLITIDDLKRMHEIEEGDQESLDKKFH